MPYAVEIEGLTRRFGDFTAVDGLTFRVREGEIFGLLGPNGSGKTTTMRILTGFMPPSSGTVEIGGYDVIENSLEVRRIVGYLPETVPLYADMTVYEYLEYMGSLRKVPHLENRIKETLEQVELSERSTSYVGTLSKGMRQRLGLAQALIHKPEVLILDEPTIGLDPGQVVNFRQLIREIGKDKTVLLSTHILPEAQQVCDRVLIINNGHIVAEDTPEQLQARLTGSQRVLIQIRGDAQEVLPLLEPIPGVIRIQLRNQDSLEIETLPGKEVRPEVARALIQAGFDLLQMQNINLRKKYSSN